MYIKQKNLQNINTFLRRGKVLIIYGARRVGKTTLINRYLEQIKENHLLVSGDDLTVREYLSSQSINKLKDFVGDNKLLVVDEAQYIPQIGLNLKLLIDNNPELKILATGSSSFELAKDILKIGYLQHPIFYYRYNERSLSNTKTAGRAKIKEKLDKGITGGDLIE